MYVYLFQEDLPPPSKSLPVKGNSQMGAYKAISTKQQTKTIVDLVQSTLHHVVLESDVGIDYILAPFSIKYVALSMMAEEEILGKLNRVIGEVYLGVKCLFIEH